MKLIQQFAAVAACAALSAAPSAGATPVAVTGTDFATVTNNGTGLGPDPHPGVLYSIAPAQGFANPLMRFDLGAYAGMTVTGPAVLTLSVSSIWPFSTLTAGFELLDLAAAYNPATAAGFQSGSVISNATLNANASASTPAGQVLSLQIAASVIQDWIDVPGSNFGVQLGMLSYSSSAGHSDVSWHAAGALAPSLAFTVSSVPSPASLPLVGLALVGLMLVRRKAAASPV